MKKMLFLAAFITATVAVNAMDVVKGEVFMKCNQEYVFSSLVNYLGMDDFQSNEMKKVFSTTENQIKRAIRIDSEESMEKAVNYNLGNAKRVLTKEQYRKYLHIINLSYHNTNTALLAKN